MNEVKYKELRFQNGKKSITLKKESWRDKPTWMFCHNGFQSTGVDIPIEMFDLIIDIVTDQQVVEMYEEFRKGEGNE
jgi:hypothetical protein